MREICIQVPKSDFEPGETVDGYVVIECDESFDCNRVVIRLRGIEKTRVVRGSGKHRRVYQEERIHIDEKRVLKEFPIFQEGQTRLEFTFEIPTEIPPSYDGTHGHIQYELKAKIELSWRFDPTNTCKLRIKHLPSDHPPISQPISLSAEDDGICILEVDTLENVISVGDSLTFSLQVNREVQIRGVRAELIRKEHVSPRGNREITEEIFCQSYIDDEKLQRDSWIESDFGTKISWPPSFKTALILSEYILKVTLDIPWKFDKSVEIPIIILPQGKPIEENQDIFGFDFE